MAGLATWLRQEGQRLERQKRVVEKLVASGAEVRYDWEYDDDGRLKQHATRSREKTWRTICGIEEDVVVRVRFPKRGGDMLLRELECLPHIRELDLSYCINISDDGLEVVPRLPALNALYLYANDMPWPNNIASRAEVEAQPMLTDRAIENIAQSNSIRRLDISINGFTDSAVGALGEMDALEHLVISQTKITSRGRARLQRCLPDCQID